MLMGSIPSLFDFSILNLFVPLVVIINIAFFLYWLLRSKWVFLLFMIAFLIGYGVFRSIVEFFREPDAHLGLYFSFISKGQILSIPMILVGFLFIYLGYLSQQKSTITDKPTHTKTAKKKVVINKGKS